MFLWISIYLILPAEPSPSSPWGLQGPVLPRAQQQGPTLLASLSLFPDLQNCWQEGGQVPAAGLEGGQVPGAPSEMWEKVLLAGLGLFWQKGPWCGAISAKPSVRSMQ